MPKINPNKLSLAYNKREKDFLVRYPRKADGNLALSQLVGRNLLFDYFGERPYNFTEFNFIKELEKRGYDPKTIKFSIELKKE